MPGRKRAIPATTASARKLAGQIVKALRLDARAYADYLDDMELAADLHGEVLSLGGVDVQLEFELRPSVLFRRAFGVGWTSEAAIAAIAPGCDAIAAPLSLIPGTVIPLVFAPRGKRRARSQQFLSVLEHEFVHVSQTLHGLTAPDYQMLRGADLVEGFFCHVRIEHEAYLVQSVHWPSAAPPPRGITFSQWCLLRSYTPALERAIEHTPDEASFGAFLDDVRRLGEQHLRELAYDEDDVKWLRARWVGDVIRATDIVHRQLGAPTPAMSAVARWIKRADIRAEVQSWLDRRTSATS